METEQSITIFESYKLSMKRKKQIFRISTNRVMRGNIFVQKYHVAEIFYASSVDDNANRIIESINIRMTFWTSFIIFLIQLNILH